MKMRYDEVDGDFNTTMLGEAIGNGSVDAINDFGGKSGDPNSSEDETQW